MKSYGGKLSHKKHRAGFGGPTPKHRAEIARMANKPKSKHAVKMFGSIRELMGR